MGVQQPWRKQWLAGDRAMKGERYSEAIQAYAEALKIMPAAAQGGKGEEGLVGSPKSLASSPSSSAAAAAAGGGVAGAMRELRGTLLSNRSAAFAR